jgi:hypothetical protein
MVRGSENDKSTTHDDEVVEAGERGGRSSLEIGETCSRLSLSHLSLAVMKPLLLWIKATFSPLTYVQEKRRTSSFPPFIAY